MATLANTHVTSGTLYAPAPLGNGLTLEVYKVAGGAVGDTSTITPKFDKAIVSVVCPQATNNVSTDGTSTNVTLTLTASAATNVSFDAWILTRAS